MAVPMRPTPIIPIGRVILTPAQRIVDRPLAPCSPIPVPIRERLRRNLFAMTSRGGWFRETCLPDKVLIWAKYGRELSLSANT